MYFGRRAPTADISQTITYPDLMERRIDRNKTPISGHLRRKFCVFSSRAAEGAAPVART